MVVLTKKLFLLGGFLIFMNAHAEAQPNSCRFKKNKWIKNVDYRYKIVKCKSFFNMLEGKSKSQIVSILGYPDLVDPTSVDDFTFCLDNEKKLVFDEERKKQVCCTCIGSLIVIHFKDEKVWEVTRVHME